MLEEQLKKVTGILAVSQTELLSREKEVTELKMAALRLEGVKGEGVRSEGVRGELVEAQRRRKMVEETVEQLQVRNKREREEEEEEKKMSFQGMLPWLIGAMLLHVQRVFYIVHTLALALAVAVAKLTCAVLYNIYNIVHALALALAVAKLTCAVLYNLL